MNKGMPTLRGRTNMSVQISNQETDTSTVSEQTLNFKVEDGMSLLLSSSRVGLNTTGQGTDIKDFLARPYNFASYTWTTAQGAGTDIFNVDLTNIILGIDMYTRKLRGFRNWRFTVNVKVVIAPSPFHAGAAYLSWQPWTCANTFIVGNMYKGLIPNSQLPGIMLTCEENSVEIAIPYIGPVAGFDRNPTSTSWGWGNLRFAIYSPLSTGTGSSSIAVDAYIWLTDVELGGLTAQSKFRTAKKTRARGMVLTDQEIGEGEGPISRVLGTGAVLANRLGDFPVLTPFFKPAAWVLNALKGTAESFGYSKPTKGEGTDYCMMARNMDAYSSNVNGSDNCITLSGLGDAKNTMNSWMQTTNVDESSIDFIKRKWSYVEAFPVSTASSPQSILYSKTIAPRGFKSSYNMPGNAGGTINYNVNWMTPFGYLAECFESYRGDIEIKLVFVKTGFHACQIEVAFSLDTVATAATEYYMREVIDIQKGNEVCFILPYARAEPFISCWDNIGMLSVTLVNTLQAPTTVSSSINVLVYYRGGENLVYTRPTQFAPIPIMGPQGGVTEESQTAMCDGPEVIGNGVSPGNKLFSQYTAGEEMKSLRQMCNKYTPIGLNNGAVVQGTTLQFDPHWLGVQNTVFTTFYNVTWSALALDLIGRFGKLFLFHSGSVKIRVKNTLALGRALKAAVFPFNPGSILDVASGTYPGLDFTVSDFVFDSNLLSNGFRVPQFSKYFAYPHINFSTNTSPYQAQAVVSINNVAGDTLLSSANTSIYRAAGEDFQFQFFLAIPTCVLFYAPQ